MGKQRYIVVLESDWSENGAEKAVGHGEPVGPPYTYREVFEGGAKTFGVQVDRAGFASESGFRALTCRFMSKPDAPYLVVGGHGTKRGTLTTAGRSFNPLRVLQDVFEQAKQRQDEFGQAKEGVLLAACDLLYDRHTAEAVLNTKSLQWVGGYRSTAYSLSAPLIELCFWRTFFNGWQAAWAVGKDEFSRVAAAGDPIRAALLTYFEIAAAVGSRFDVCVQRGDGLVSSIEVFSHLVGEGNGWLDLHYGGALNGVTASDASRVAATKYGALAKRVWRHQWEWKVQT